MRQTVLVVLVCLTVVVLALQNTISIPLHLLNTSRNVSLTFIIAFAFTAGCFTVFILLNNQKSTDKTRIKELKRKIVFLETPDSYNKQD